MKIKNFQAENSVEVFPVFRFSSIKVFRDFFRFSLKGNLNFFMMIGASTLLIRNIEEQKSIKYCVFRHRRNLRSNPGERRDRELLSKNDNKT